MSHDEARFEGYREGRAAVWREVHDWAAENLAIAERILGHPLVTAEDVRGILADYGDSTPDRHRSDTLGPCLACRKREADRTLTRNRG